MKKFAVISTLAATICFYSSVFAGTFYMKNGDEFEYEKYWLKNGRIYVQINKEAEADFGMDEVDLKRMNISDKSNKILSTDSKFSSPKEEITNIYGRFYSAMRSGDYNEMLRYVTGKQKRMTEKLINGSEQEKTLFKQLFANMPTNYTVTSISLSKNGKTATLKTKRKINTEVYDINGVKTHDESSWAYNIADFIKENNEWKIASAQDKM